MTGKANPHHVINFTFVPVGGAPDIRNGWDFEMIFGDAQFESQMFAALELVKLVDHFKPRFFTEMIDARDIEEISESEFFFATRRECREFGAFDQQRGLAAKFRRARYAKPRFKRFDGGLECGGGHETKPERVRRVQRIH